ncbi:hypothetical protein CB0940_04083 [Cercospora beticola]|uniref:AB hydrolase-1 domain-containing protein n=1 Tax=Cercospora beticola TaxID=122368 RepID=A0A2G5HLA0_CERBT|nr:hypothetical protein CB0940_04083 [Cercospora beticola]PIA93308.1 hypothetical protein CB0940_04083 [Cercospora beticola]WPB01296.1 hypothetical protein RHO25_005920 [Cercospora beticola]
MNPVQAYEATNLNSKFTPFRLRLSNGAQVSGIAYIPSLASDGTEIGRPLLVGIHGGTCSAYNYDASSDCTASVHADLFALPFVAINRPNYLDSSGWVVDRKLTEPYDPKWKPTPGRAYFEEEAHWFHDLIFPAIWKDFGASNGCTSIVTTAHSIGVVPSIIAAGMYAEQAPDERQYLWSGMILSGLAPESTGESQKLFTMTGDDGQCDLGYLSKSLKPTSMLNQCLQLEKRN